MPFDVNTCEDKNRCAIGEIVTEPAAVEFTAVTWLRDDSAPGDASCATSSKGEWTAVTAQGIVALARADFLQIFSADGTSLWHQQSRGTGELTRPIIVALANWQQHLVVGSTDGLVQCLDVMDGGLVWEATNSAAVSRVVLPRRDDTSALVLLSDGRVSLTKRGDRVWDANLLRNAEQFTQMEVERNFGRWIATAEICAVEVLPRDVIAIVDMKTGQFVGQAPAPLRKRAWTVEGDNLIVAFDEEVVSYSLGVGQ